MTDEDKTELSKSAMLVVMHSLMLKVNDACIDARTLLRAMRHNIRERELFEAELLMTELHIIMSRWGLRHDGADDRQQIIQLCNMAETQADTLRARLAAQQ